MYNNFISVQYSKVLHLSARIAFTVDGTVLANGNTSRVAHYVMHMFKYALQLTSARICK